MSHHNTLSSLKGAWNAGVRGVIHKATEGQGYRDNMLGTRAMLAADAGLLFGTYHFLRPGDMKAQAKLFVDYTLAETDGVFGREDLLFAADHEDAGVSLENLKTFLREVERLTGKKPIIYSGNVLKEQLQTDDDEISAHPLWLAQYSSSPSLPAGFSKYFLWQYTDGNAGPSPKSVPGINPPVDCNDFQGSDAELASAWLGQGAPPIPLPVPPSMDYAMALVIETDGSYTITVPAGTVINIIEV